MDQSEAGRGSKIICPICNQYGQRITCTSGSRSEVIVYHPSKKVRTICRIANGKVEMTEDERSDDGPFDEGSAEISVLNVEHQYSLASRS